ncbi:hypothetical protein G6L08_34285 [Agrobacterium rhizogenes]|nr:hypothetical protein [Rhizobium rhizogenes]NTG32213.1 hypothetical protein [Rhizobium rhizogenes]
MTTPSTKPAGAPPVVDAQISLVPASDRFIPIILDAVAEIGAIEGLDVASDAISSHLAGRADIVFSAIETILRRAADSGAHLVLTVLAAARADGRLSPEAGEDAFQAVAPSDVAIATQFALLGGSRQEQSMLLRETIGVFTKQGMALTQKALVTRADGDAATLFSAYAGILTLASRQGARTTLAITAVANIPSAEAFA